MRRGDGGQDRTSLTGAGPWPVGGSRVLFCLIMCLHVARILLYFSMCYLKT